MRARNTQTGGTTYSKQAFPVSPHRVARRSRNKEKRFKLSAYRQGEGDLAGQNVALYT